MGHKITYGYVNEKYHTHRVEWVRVWVHPNIDRWGLCNILTYLIPLAPLITHLGSLKLTLPSSTSAGALFRISPTKDRFTFCLVTAAFHIYLPYKITS
jgi:hypothetical protein